MVFWLAFLWQQLENSQTNYQYGMGANVAHTEENNQNKKGFPSLSFCLPYVILISYSRVNHPLTSLSQCIIRG